MHLIVSGPRTKTMRLCSSLIVDVGATQSPCAKMVISRPPERETFGGDVVAISRVYHDCQFDKNRVSVIVR